MIGWSEFPYFASVTALVALVGAVAATRERTRRMATVALWLATAVMGLFIALLWIGLERPPMRTMGETRLWYSFCLLVSGAFTFQRWNYRWIPSFATMLSTVFMVVNILKPEIHDATLMPALQSAWFVPHVSIYMFSYALLGCATMLAVYGVVAHSDMDRAVERLLYGGIAFFTVGMLTGALWAKQAWGEYWSWDAKESWAAATWFLYLLAIHLYRLNAKSRKTICAVLVIAFLSLQMCWYGVNYLPTAKTSVHTYNK